MNYWMVSAFLIIGFRSVETGQMKFGIGSLIGATLLAIVSSFSEYDEHKKLQELEKKVAELDRRTRITKY